MLKYFKEDYIVMRLNFSHSGWDYTQSKDLVYSTTNVLLYTVYTSTCVFSTNWNET
jgi:hypothetical protein